MEPVLIGEYFLNSDFNQYTHTEVDEVADKGSFVIFYSVTNTHKHIQWEDGEARLEHQLLETWQSSQWSSPLIPQQLSVVFHLSAILILGKKCLNPHRFANRCAGGSG